MTAIPTIEWLDSEIGDDVVARLREIIATCRATGETIAVGEDDPGWSELRRAALPGISSDRRNIREEMEFDAHGITLRHHHLTYTTMYLPSLRVYYGDPGTWYDSTKYGAGGAIIGHRRWNHTI